MDGFEKFTSFFFTTGLNLQCSVVTHGVVSLIISNPDLFASQVRSIEGTIPIKYLDTTSSCPATISRYDLLQLPHLLDFSFPYLEELT
ncbi:hypothetical protein B296_00020965 [Ensete ventricosum]|uniref:Uncharacterized protein n=1 Tax=Ensete ventricosum TaxID=4639 RepID=A0A426ZFB3_ENSVE|nr:hypothetical protein B296_00020965 [Ensete ventricosum]